jgi:hypothetical protein
MLALVACGGAPPRESKIARVHHAQCSRCHTRVEPGERTEDELEKAFVRHRARVRLTEEEWRAMVDYLAKRESD